MAQNLLGWDPCTLDLFDNETSAISPLLTIDTIDGRRMDMPNVFTNVLPNSMTRRVVQSGAQLTLRAKSSDSSLKIGAEIAVRAEDSSTSGLLMFGDTSRRSASLMFVPIRVQEQAIGVLSLQSYTHKVGRRLTKWSFGSFRPKATYAGWSFADVRSMMPKGGRIGRCQRSPILANMAKRDCSQSPAM